MVIAVLLYHISVVDSTYIYATAWKLEIGNQPSDYVHCGGNQELVGSLLFLSGLSWSLFGCRGQLEKVSPV